MLTKQHEKLRRRWMLGRLNIAEAARKLGYRGGSMTKGIDKVKTLLAEMGITVL